MLISIIGLVRIAKTQKMIRVFANRYPLVGPLLWALSLQYFAVQIIVAQAWKIPPYSIFHNTISDLGNTSCGSYNLNYVCSPLHSLMNASFIMLGITMFFGSFLIYQEFRKTSFSALGFSAMGASAIGTAMVGLFPENSISALHILGASLPFLIGNIGLIILGKVLDLPRWFSVSTVIGGMLTIVFLGLFITHNYLGVGIGGMERLVAYPQTFWLVSLSAYMTRNHYKNVMPRRAN